MLKFKTNAQCGGCIAAIGTQLNKIMEETEWRINLRSPEKVLTVDATVPAVKVIEAVQTAGYQAEELHY